MKKFGLVMSKACQVGALLAACVLMVGCNTAGQGQDATVTQTEPEVDRQQMEIVSVSSGKKG